MYWLGAVTQIVWASPWGSGPKRTTVWPSACKDFINSGYCSGISKLIWSGNHWCENRGALTVSLSELAPSYIHMHVNRLIRSAQRAHELVLYDLLARLYESKLARAKKP